MLILLEGPDHPAIRSCSGNLGGLAQLVERFVRNEEVRSSNLLTSTKSALRDTRPSDTPGRFGCALPPSAIEPRERVCWSAYLCPRRDPDALPALRSNDLPP